MDDNLEAELRSLSAHLDTPPPPDIAAAVHARLSTPDPTPTRPARPWRRRAGSGGDVHPPGTRGWTGWRSKLRLPGRDGLPGRDEEPGDDGPPSRPGLRGWAGLRGRLGPPGGGRTPGGDDLSGRDGTPGRDGSRGRLGSPGGGETPGLDGPGGWGGRLRDLVPRTRVRKWAYVVLAAVILVTATPQGRAVAGNLLRFAGIEFSSAPPPSPAVSPSLPEEMRTSLDGARAVVKFKLLAPSVLGPPDEVIVSDGGRVATLIYGDTRLDQFDGRVSEEFFSKFIKVKPDTYQPTTVGPANAMWIIGPHVIWYRDRDGVERTESARTTKGNTLIWQSDDTAIRLEGVLTLAEARRIAASLR